MLLVTLVALSSTSFGQNMLSASPEKIERYVRESYPGMVQEENLRNEYYNYLKYSDSKNNRRTILFFMSDQNRCNAIRFIYEAEAKDEVAADLNKRYSLTGNNRWSDQGSREKAIVELKDEEWFITVTIKPAEKERKNRKVEQSSY